VTAHAKESVKDLHFTVYRDNQPIGMHHVSFEKKGDKTIVSLTISFRVKFFGLVVYNYHHRNKEVWQKDRLISLESKTNDNGTPYFVTVTKRNNRLHVKSNAESYDVPLTTMTTSYWHRAMIYQKNLINTQNGKLLAVTIDTKDIVPLKNMTEYTITGDLKARIRYDNQGHWSGLSFIAKGSDIVYRPQISKF
jgi:hypothetical protein